MKKLISLIGVISILLTMSVSVFANVVATEYIITNNGKPLFSNEEVFVENDMVYLPLEELLDKLEITKNPYSYLHIENNKFSLYIEGGSTDDIYNMEIGKRQIVYTQSPVTYAPATRETMYAPILRNDLIYIPFEYMDYIFNSRFYDSGLYHIELKSDIEQQDIKKIDDGSVAMEAPAENSYIGWLIGGGAVVFVIGFVIGYNVRKKKQK